MEEKLKKIRDLIAKDKTELALNSLAEIDNLSEKYSNAVSTISASFSDVRGREIRNTISFAELSVQKSKITSSLLEVVTSIEKDLKTDNNNQVKPKKRLIQKSHIEILINHQRSSLRYFLFYSFGLIGIGIIVIIIGMQLSNETMKTAMNIGGGLISSLSGFPIRELLQRKGKIKTFEILAIQLGSANEGNFFEDDTSRLNELVWKIIEKTALTI